ncbi:MAG: hypothetical protein JW929_07595 [Anaerolineales bacterium]|nr:hypothetical protein [Anaerolineales bacterium]
MRNKAIPLGGLLLLCGFACGPVGADSTAAEFRTAEPLASVTETPTAVNTAVTLYPVATATATPTPVPGTLFVQADAELGDISPFLYGTNYGPWQNLSRKTKPVLQEVGLRFLRYPGGEYGDRYVFIEGRLDEFIALSGELGAEPMVNVKLPNSTAKSAAQAVQYANVDQRHAVRYWAIGNEPDLYDEKFNMPDYGTGEFNRDWREFALAMKAVDPSILLIGPEISQFTGDPRTDPRDRDGKDWLREFLRANGDLVDVVSVHRYPFGQTAPALADLKTNPAEWDLLIPNLRDVIRSELGRDLPVAVTEFNSDWTNSEGGETTPDSFANALWLADVLGRMGRQRVDFAAHFCLEGAGGHGLTQVSAVRPSLYVFEMYKSFGNRLVHASSDTPLLSIYGAKTGEGILTLMVVNLNDRDISKTITIAGLEYGQAAETRRFDRSTDAELGDAATIDGKTPYVFPAESVTLFILPSADT